MDAAPSPWNEKKKVVVNHMSYDQEHSLFVLATSKGYRIFDSKTLVLLSKVDDFQDIIGDIMKAQTLYRSQLVFFVGTENNLCYVPSQLIIWNDVKKAKIGLLFLKDPIFDFEVTKNLIFVFSTSKIYIFELKTFRYITKIENINMNSKLFSISKNDILAFNTYKKKNVINVRFFKYEDFAAKGVKKMEIDCSFKDIQLIKVSESGNNLIAVSFLGNKMHVYGLEKGILKLCLFFGDHIIAIDNLDFSPKKEKYIMFITQQKKIQVFSIKTDSKEKIQCNCAEHKDEILLGKVQKEEERRGSFLGGFFGGGTIVLYFLILFIESYR